MENNYKFEQIGEIIKRYVDDQIKENITQLKQSNQQEINQWKQLMENQGTQSNQQEEIEQMKQEINQLKGIIEGVQVTTTKKTASEQEYKEKKMKEKQEREKKDKEQMDKLKKEMVELKKNQMLMKKKESELNQKMTEKEDMLKLLNLEFDKRTNEIKMIQQDPINHKHNWREVSNM